MFKARFLCFAVLMFAVSYSPAVEETSLAELTPAQQKAVDVQDAIRSGDTTLPQAWTSQVDTLVEALPRGQKLMGEFDANLDNAVTQAHAVDIFTDPAYIKLLLLRGRVESIGNELAASYGEAWKVVLGEVPDLNSADDVELATQYVQALHKLIQNKSFTERVALYRLGDALQDVRRDIHESVERGSAQQSRLFAEFDQTLKQVSFPDISKAYESAMPDIRGRMQGLSATSPLAVELKAGDDLARNQPQLTHANSAFKNITGAGFPKGKWALTFDDGPHKSITAKMLQVLSDHGTKATFFELSNNVKALPSVSKSVYDAGHEIGDHSVDHADLSKLSAAKIEVEVSGSRDVIEKTLHAQGATNYHTKYFRAPYGAGIYAPQSQKLIDAIVAAGLTHVLWNVDSLDWQDKNSESVRNRVIKQMTAQKRGVILFHDIQSPTPTTLGLVYDSDYVKSNHITFSGVN